MLDLTLALVPRCVEQRPMNLRSQLRCQQPDGREMNRTVREPLENQRKSSCGSGSFDPVEGGVF
jgi:hypothetical protein